MQNYKVKIHDQVFDLVYYGKGFTHHEVYNMPIYLRLFYMRKINHIFTEQNKAHEKAMKEARTKQSANRAKPPKIKR